MVHVRIRLSWMRWLEADAASSQGVCVCVSVCERVIHELRPLCGGRGDACAVYLPRGAHLIFLFSVSVFWRLTVIILHLSLTVFNRRRLSRAPLPSPYS